MLGFMTVIFRSLREREHTGLPAATAAGVGVCLALLGAGCEPGESPSQLTSAVVNAASAGEPAPGSTLAPNAVVQRVIDGDTIVAKIGKQSEPVRLLGIDTPESVARARPVQCYGKEASAYLSQLLPEGTAVSLVIDEEPRDIYGRLLAYVVRSGDGLFINYQMVEAGYATVLNYPPNDSYASDFARAESLAVKEGLGLWTACGGPDVPVS